MRNFPILLLHAFRPTPKTSLSDSSRLVGPDVFVQVEAVASGLVNHKTHLVGVFGGGFLSGNLRGQVESRNFALAYCHMAHLRPAKTHAISRRVNSFVTSHAHHRIDVYIPIAVSDVHVMRC